MKKYMIPFFFLLLSTLLNAQDNPKLPGFFEHFTSSIIGTDSICFPIIYTYKYQTLDVRINGIIKTKSKAIWRSEKIINPEFKITNADRIKHLLTSINEISTETIIKSFYKSCFIKKI